MAMKPSRSAAAAGGRKMLDEIAGDFEGLIEGRARVQPRDGGPSVRSKIGLDLVNLFEADVTTGVGPFLAVYLNANRHWDPGLIGIAISAQGIAALLAQVPAGALVDATHRKRGLLAVASLS